LLLTLKQKYQAILQNPRANFMVKSSRNNGGRGPNARLCAQDGREEEGENGPSFLYCHFITVGSWLEPTVIEPNHYRFLARTSNDKWPSTHCRCQLQTSSDVDFHCRFWSSPNHFLIFKLRPAVKVHHCRFTQIRQ
jgi:hypothetical protein